MEISNASLPTSEATVSRPVRLRAHSSRRGDRQTSCSRPCSDKQLVLPRRCRGNQAFVPPSTRSCPNRAPHLRDESVQQQRSRSIFEPHPPTSTFIKDNATPIRSKVSLPLAASALVIDVVVDRTSRLHARDEDDAGQTRLWSPSRLPSTVGFAARTNLAKSRRLASATCLPQAAGSHRRHGEQRARVQEAARIERDRRTSPS